MLCVPNFTQCCYHLKAELKLLTIKNQFAWSSKAGQLLVNILIIIYCTIKINQLWCNFRTQFNSPSAVGAQFTSIVHAAYRCSGSLNILFTEEKTIPIPKMTSERGDCIISATSLCSGVKTGKWQWIKADLAYDRLSTGSTKTLSGYGDAVVFQVRLQTAQHVIEFIGLVRRRHGCWACGLVEWCRVSGGCRLRCRWLV